MRRPLEFLPQVDGLRFVAVLGVILHHWCAEYFKDSIFLSGIPFGTGVNLFYVISGFLITYILLGKKEDIAEKQTTFGKEIRNFFAKRTLRIFPIYYLAIIILCITSYDEIKGYLLYLLTYTSNWYMVFTNNYIGSMTHTWSLAVEEQFYLIWPFLLFLVPKRWVLGMIMVFILGSFVSKIWFFFDSPYVMGANGATFSCFDSLGFGALIAYNKYYNIIPFSIRWARVALWGSLALYIALYIWPHWLTSWQWSNVSFNTATSVVFFFMIYIAANSGYTGFWKGFLENRVVLYLGRISYGLYLYHLLVTKMFWGGMNAWFPKIVNPFDVVALNFILLVILATLSWYLIERPLLSLKKKFQ